MLELANDVPPARCEVLTGRGLTRCYAMELVALAIAEMEHVETACDEQASGAMRCDEAFVRRHYARVLRVLRRRVHGLRRPNCSVRSKPR